MTTHTTHKGAKTTMIETVSCSQLSTKLSHSTSRRPISAHTAPRQRPDPDTAVPAGPGQTSQCHNPAHAAAGPRLAVHHNITRRPAATGRLIWPFKHWNEPLRRHLLLQLACSKGRCRTGATCGAAAVHVLLLASGSLVH